VLFSLSCFHTIFAFASVYLTMLVTNWGGDDDTGSVASWVTFGAAWLSYSCTDGPSSPRSCARARISLHSAAFQSAVIRGHVSFSD
jgi:hypothetical protein